MLWTIFLLLMIMWLLGMVSSYTLGGFIHILLINRHRRGVDPRHPGPESDIATRAMEHRFV
jgi:uncharacterized protein DUF5670